MLIMLGLAVAYVHFGTTHIAVSALDGIRPVVVAIVAWALFDLGKRILMCWALWPIAIAVFALSLTSAFPILLLALAGIAGIIVTVPLPPARNQLGGLLGVGKAMFPIGVTAAHSGRLAAVFLTFLKRAPYRTVAATCSSPSCTLPSWTTFIGSPMLSWRMQWPSARRLRSGSGLHHCHLPWLPLRGSTGSTSRHAGQLPLGFRPVLLLDRIVQFVDTHVSARAFLDAVMLRAPGHCGGQPWYWPEPLCTIPDCRSRRSPPFPILIFLQPLSSPALIVAGAVVGVIAGR